MTGQIECVKRWPALDGHGEVEIEIRQVFQADDFGPALTPEIRRQEEEVEGAGEDQALMKKALSRDCCAMAFGQAGKGPPIILVDCALNAVVQAGNATLRLRAPHNRVSSSCDTSALRS